MFVHPLFFVEVGSREVENYEFRSENFPALFWLFFRRLRQISISGNERRPVFDAWLKFAVGKKLPLR
jgi:hypothetical protein